MIIETKFDLRERVRIPSLENISALVLSIELNRLGTDYDIRYIHNGEVKTGWFMEDELEKAKH